MASINQLSEETLEQIFLDLPVCMIPELTTVCRKFNEVVSNSVNLMKFMEVQWQKNKSLDMRPLLESTRKFRLISIIEMSRVSPSLQSFLHNHSNTLTCISFNECAMTSSELESVLKSLPNLVELNMCEVNFEVDSEVSAVDLKELKSMETMYMYGDGLVGVLGFFATAKIERFQYEDNFEMNEEETEKFRDFLMSQQNLKKLSLTSNIAQKLLSDEKFVKLHELKCEDIFLWMNRDDQEGGQFLQFTQLETFLWSQRNFLKTLTLGRTAIPLETLRHLLSLHLEDIRFVSCTFPDSRKIAVTNSTVKSMFVSMMETVDTETEKVLCDIMRSCKNVEKLRFSCMDITFEMSLVIAYELKHLTKLKLYNSHLIPVTFPRLTHLEILSSGSREILRLIRVNRSLKSVTVGNSFMFSQKFFRALSETEIEEVIYVPA